MTAPDQQLETAIVAAGANVAPRITPADIEANIVDEVYFTALDGYAGTQPGTDAEFRYGRINSRQLSFLTFCVLILKNGTKVVGVNEGPVSPENFNAELGRQYARQKAIDQVWPMLGYELRSKLAFGDSGYTAADMAHAAAKGFRDGEASAKAAASEDFTLPAKACDLSGEGACEACQ